MTCYHRVQEISEDLVLPNYVVALAVLFKTGCPDKMY